MRLGRARAGLFIPRISRRSGTRRGSPPLSQSPTPSRPHAFSSETSHAPGWLPQLRLRFLGQPDRIPVRAPADLRDGQLQPSQSHGLGPPAPRLPALEQRQRPPPRHPCRTTPRTPPHPQRTTTALGPPTP